MAPKTVIPKVEFYITNVCNLACPRCNRFNDFNFAGWQRWTDYADEYARWADTVEINQIVILGGEPLLNPSICEWVRGLNDLWHKSVQVLTNGTRLNSTPGFYDAINYAPPRAAKNWVGISIHNKNDVQWYLDEVRKFLQGDIEFREDKNILNEYGDSWTAGADYWFCDSNGVRVLLWLQDSFYNAAVHPGPNGQLTLYNSDPEEAHYHCGFRRFKCYHFIRGKLYKCGPVALFPEFDQQHNLDISNEDRQLLNSYRPFSVEDFAERGGACLEEIEQCIPQCKFCWTLTDLKQETIVAFQKRKDAKNSTNIR